MPYYQSVLYPATTTGAQPSLNLDPSIASFNATLGVTLGSGASATYLIQYTIDDFSSPTMTDAAATWFNSSLTTTAITTNVAGLQNFPVTRVRVNFTVAVAGGSVSFKCLQGLSVN